MISTPPELAKQQISLCQSHEDYVIITTASFTINYKIITKYYNQFLDVQSPTVPPNLLRPPMFATDKIYFNLEMSKTS